MLLAVDIGNSETVIGAFVEDSLYHHWRVATKTSLTRDEVAVTIDSLLRLDGMKSSDLDAAVIASVVPSLTSAYVGFLRDRNKFEAIVIEGDSPLGFEVAYERPYEIGADRLVNCLATVAKYGSPAIVVDFGTATTFDVIDDRKVYIGGAIASGLETSLAGLIHKAARLTPISLAEPTALVGTTTEESLRSGLVYGAACMVDGMVERIGRELNIKPTVIATGGFSSLVGPLCKCVDRIDEWLTLDGLLLAHRRLRPAS